MRHRRELRSRTLTVTVAGRNRTVIVHVPTGYSGSIKVALVLNLHGSGSTAADQEAFTGMDATADGDGFIVAYPQGLIPEGSGFDWNVPGGRSSATRPSPPARPTTSPSSTTLVHILEQRYCIDSNRVYATGFSGGSRMASQLALRRVGHLRGGRPGERAAPSAAVPDDEAGARSSPSTAPPTPSIPTTATVRPTGPTRFPRRRRTGRPRTAARATPTTSHPPPAHPHPVPGCAGGATVELYTITGEGHEWPGGPHLPRSLTDVLGPQSNAVDANAVMWAFFAAHPLTPPEWHNKLD